MENSDSIRLLAEAQKQTEHLRVIRNWVAFGGIMVIILPIVWTTVKVLGLIGILASMSNF